MSEQITAYFNNIATGVKSFITGLSLTFEHFKNKKENVATLQYPHEKFPLPEKKIGFEPSEYNVIRSRLHVDIDDCIEQALEVGEIINNGHYDGSLTNKKWWKL